MATLIDQKARTCAPTTPSPRGRPERRPPHPRPRRLRQRAPARTPTPTRSPKRRPTPSRDARVCPRSRSAATWARSLTATWNATRGRPRVDHRHHAGHGHRPTRSPTGTRSAPTSTSATAPPRRTPTTTTPTGPPSRSPTTASSATCSPSSSRTRPTAPGSWPSPPPASCSAPPATPSSASAPTTPSWSSPTWSRRPRSHPRPRTTRCTTRRPAPSRRWSSKNDKPTGLDWTGIAEPALDHPGPAGRPHGGHRARP